VTACSPLKDTKLQYSKPTNEAAPLFFFMLRKIKIQRLLETGVGTGRHFRSTPSPQQTQPESTAD
jgi:hypothetical protein